ncbi:prolyl 3-hydroxylase 1-like isoform X2 [Frieseomelitta varia]|uniref:prolyl 3-hydroxylase 1-like isoform X2 n=1 Tax=Frieseomelitta varia TaxID=561572 RepID=UPI001CB69EDC|nr:prolyl 3-hydroxylase 1-like isoform X2 [Frieseomelitta varia]
MNWDDRGSTTMTRLVILLFFCGVITGSNDTVSNTIPDNVLLDLEEQNEESTSTKNRTLKELYEDAVHAYLDEDWGRCIQDFNAVSHGYKAYKRMITNCRRKCRTKAAGSAPIFAENIEDLHFYEKKVRETLCLLTCNQEYREIVGSKALKMLPRETEQKLLRNSVYEYLHICYYQKHRYQDAANALFTYLVEHPKDKVNLDLLKRYLTHPGVKLENVVNLELPTYVRIYFQGVSSYEDENYAEAVGLFEASLRLYLETEEECRFYCEGPFDQGWHPEFTSSIANHFAYCLKCKRACSRTLNNVNGDYRRHMLRDHYNYLHYSYYKLGNLKAACAAVESYLLFDPVDKVMLQNKDYYSAKPKVREDYFSPREETFNYIKRQEYELRLLHYISNEFSVLDEKFNKIRKTKQDEKANNAEEEELGKKSDIETVSGPPPGYSLFSHMKLLNNSTIRVEGIKIHDIHLVAKEEDLGGKNRYVADNLLNSTECESLMQFATMTAIEGDGYDENKSPHSKHEKFEGITVGRAALMVYFGQIKPEWLELLLEKTEQVRSHVEKYFGVDRHLYFTYTHLVCRTALPGNFHPMHHRASGSFRSRNRVTPIHLTCQWIEMT